MPLVFGGKSVIISSYIELPQVLRTYCILYCVLGKSIISRSRTSHNFAVIFYIHKCANSLQAQENCKLKLLPKPQNRILKMATHDFESIARQRVNGASLNDFHGKAVCLLGTILKADGGGSAFQVRSSDGHPVTIRLKDPISEPLSGLVEVYGIGQGKSLILADNITTFPHEISANFDIATYNELVNIICTMDKAENPWASV